MLKRLFIQVFQLIFNNHLLVLLTQADGTSMVTDTIYSARFKHIDELRRMNATCKSGRQFCYYYMDQLSFMVQR